MPRMAEVFVRTAAFAGGRATCRVAVLGTLARPVR